MSAAHGYKPRLRVCPLARPSTCTRHVARPLAGTPWSPVQEVCVACPIAGPAAGRDCWLPPLCAVPFLTCCMDVAVTAGDCSPPPLNGVALPMSAPGTLTLSCHALTSRRWHCGLDPNKRPGRLLRSAVRDDGVTSLLTCRAERILLAFSLPANSAGLAPKRCNTQSHATMLHHARAVPACCGPGPSPPPPLHPSGPLTRAVNSAACRRPPPPTAFWLAVGWCLGSRATRATQGSVGAAALPPGEVARTQHGN